MGKKKAADIVGGFVVPIDDVNMDTEDSVPDTPEQQTTEPTTAAVLTVVEPPFTDFHVPKRQRHRAMIEACALPNCALDKLGDAIQRHLRTLATIVGPAELVHLPKDGTGPVEPYVVFEVLSEAQLTAISLSGITINMGLEDTPTPFLYRPYTVEQQQQLVSRRVILKAMAFNTTADDVKVAMATWGPVTYVKMGYNSQKSMRTATVTFQDPSAVTAMITAKTTCLAVGRSGDVACVAQMGTEVIPINSSLTKKLTKLPPFFKPIDVVKIFEAVPTLEGAFPCQGITMPLDVRTKRRQPHAFVYFATEAQWERVRTRIFTIDKYRTAWSDVHTLLCRVCSSPDHIQVDCPIQQKRNILRHIRKVNTLNMQPNSKSTTATTTSQGTTAKTTKAQATKAQPQHTKASSPSNTNKSVSYSAALQGKEKTFVKNTPPELIKHNANIGNTTYTNGKGKERATSPVAGPSRSVEEQLQVGQELRRRMADLQQQCEMDKQKWNAFQLRFEQMTARVAAVEQSLASLDVKIDQILAALSPVDTQITNETDMDMLDMSPVIDTPHTDTSIIVPATPENASMHPIPTSPDAVIGKRGSNSRAEQTTIAPKPHTNKMDSNEQLQLKLTAVQAELQVQLDVVAEAAVTIEDYRRMYGELQQTKFDILDQRAEHWADAAAAADGHHSDVDL